MVQWNRLILLDVETVPILPDFDQLSEPMQKHWTHKSAQKYPDASPDDPLCWERAGIYAEFGKIVCICAGYLRKVGTEYCLEVQHFIGTEHDILTDFFAFLLKMNPTQLGGHNIREFDIPYICRRSFIQQVPLPPLLTQLQAIKPWDNPLVDTLQLWKFGEYKNYVSIDLLCTLLGLESPKHDIAGQDVSRIYWQARNIQRIADYCEQDVLAVTRVLMRLVGFSMEDINNVSLHRHERNKRYYSLD